MAITKTYLDLLDAAIGHLRQSAPPPKPLRTLCLSVPDVLVSPAELEKRYPGKCLGLAIRDDSEAILRYHGRKEDSGPVPDTKSLMQLLGLRPEFVDVKKLRGYERILDLNEKIPTQLMSKFKLILDSGTLEHCFNVGQAFKNMCAFCDVGGIVITTAPATMVNHGFWNFSPTAYVDGFMDNGFKILFLGVQGNSKGMQNIPINHATRRMALGSESVLYCVAEKLAQKEFAWPTQSKYKHMLEY